MGAFLCVCACGCTLVYLFARVLGHMCMRVHACECVLMHDTLASFIEACLTEVSSLVRG